MQGVDVEHYITQGRRIQNKQVLGKISEYFQSHPMIHKRLKALEYFADSELYYKVTKKTPQEGRKLISTDQLNKKVDGLLSVL